MPYHVFDCSNGPSGLVAGQVVGQKRKNTWFTHKLSVLGLYDKNAHKIDFEPIFDTPAGDPAKLVYWVLTLYNHCGNDAYSGRIHPASPTSDLRRGRLKLLIAFLVRNRSAERRAETLKSTTNLVMLGAISR